MIFGGDDVEYNDNARNAGKRALPIDLRGGGQPELLLGGCNPPTHCHRGPIMSPKPQ